MHHSPHTLHSLINIKRLAMYHYNRYNKTTLRVHQVTSKLCHNIYIVTNHTAAYSKHCTRGPYSNKLKPACVPIPILKHIFVRLKVLKGFENCYNVLRHPRRQAEHKYALNDEKVHVVFLVVAMEHIRWGVVTVDHIGTDAAEAEKEPEHHKGDYSCAGYLSRVAHGISYRE